VSLAKFLPETVLSIPTNQFHYLWFTRCIITFIKW